ncbi:MAG TPA: class I tRNA ligase family protein [Candidatus Nanoarchaeia archaeon]|nr:class I tRNA ligase family protein [Candidatus Nanoarchaeia archaeon]
MVFIKIQILGTPLPIWKCTQKECDGEKAIGSIEELKKESLKNPDGEVDLHRPWVDKIKLKCDKCGGEMERVKDVIDCWYDSGSASFAQFHYPFENKEEFEKRFPYDFIGEAIDQTRGWFYTLHVLATILFDKPAYKNVICAGHVVDEKGEKMSKSKGNVIKPREIIDKAGVDAVRLQFLTSDAGNQKRFSYNLMKERVLPFLRVLYNSYKYYTQLEEVSVSSDKLCKEDKWILSRLNSTIEGVTESLKNYNLNKPFEKLYDFVVNDVSKKYIKITRERNDNKEILKDILEKVSLLLAPLAPYLTEYIYSEFSKDSVHLSSWPKSQKGKIDKKLEKEFEKAFYVIENGLSERDRKGVGLRWPLRKAIIKGEPGFSDEMNEIIKSELNVKELVFDDSEEEKVRVELDTEMDEELRTEGYAREISRKVQAFRKKLGLDKKDKVKTYIGVDDEFKNVLKKQSDFIKQRTNSEELIITTDEELKKENFKNVMNFVIKDKRGDVVIEPIQ